MKYSTEVFFFVTFYMGGISQDVKRLNMWDFYPLFLGFLDHLHFYCFDETYHVF